MDLVLAALATLPLAGAHLGAPLLSFVNRNRRGPLLSAGGGVAVAYVFVHLLPEVAAAQSAVDESASGLVAGLERHAYVMALLGLAVFYGLERAAVRSKGDGGDDPSDPDSATSRHAFCATPPCCWSSAEPVGPGGSSRPVSAVESPAAPRRRWRRTVKGEA